MTSSTPKVPHIDQFFGDVLAERHRQIRKWGDQRHPDGTGRRHYGAEAQQWKDRCEDAERDGTQNWALILLEEAFEACEEDDPASLRAELIQVAAVAQAWVAHLDDRAASTADESRDATTATPCGPVPNACEGGGEPCERHEREQAHAEGEHELCGDECPEVPALRTAWNLNRQYD